MFLRASVKQVWPNSEQFMIPTFSMTGHGEIMKTKHACQNSVQ